MDKEIFLSQKANEAISRFQARILYLLLVKFSLLNMTAWGFLWGTLILVFRAGFGVSGFPSNFGFIGLPVCIFLAYSEARKHVPSEEKLRSFLDQWSGCGGLLVASAEVELQNWWEKVSEISVPDLNWKGKNAIGFLSMAIVFASSAAFIPDSYVIPAAMETLEIKSETTKLSEQIDTLKEEGFLPEEKAESLKRELSDIASEASGKDPGKTLEALDHLEKAAKQAANEAAQELLNRAEAIGNAEKSAENLSDPNPYLGKGSKKDALEELASQTENALNASGSGMHGRSFPGLKSMGEGNLSPEMMKSLSEALKAGRETISGKLGKLEKVGLIDKETAKMCEKQGKGETGSMAVLIPWDKDSKKPPDAAILVDGGSDSEKPGEGSVTRGKGDAKLNFSGKTSEEGFKFKEKTLPEADLKSLRDAKKIGTSISTPVTDTTGQSSSGGVLNGNKTDGGTAFTREVLPKYRGTVRRYFNRK